MHTFETIAKASVPKSVKPRILELRRFQARLHEYYNIPLRSNGWNEYSEALRLLEKSDKTYKAAQEMWNLPWLIDELRNIESSIEQMDNCIEEYLKLDKDSVVK